MARKVKWHCATCKTNVLGPGRPRMDNMVRYCVPCSVARGFLVTRRRLTDINRETRREALENELKNDSPNERLEADLRHATRPRVNHRSWMQADSAICFTPMGTTYSIWCIAEYLCKSKRWGKTVERIGRRLAGSDKPCVMGKRKHIGQAMIKVVDHHMSQLWKYTAMFNGRKGFKPSIRMKIKGAKFSGRGGPTYGVTCTLPLAVDGMQTELLAESNAKHLELILHELVHVAHLSVAHCSFSGGKWRAHDLYYNEILCDMAKHFFGFPSTARQAGWSKGRGYEPSRTLRSWLKREILRCGDPVDSYRNPKLEGLLSFSC